jgi:LysR family hydrogen peroxide-inducible transcriptional activator
MISLRQLRYLSAVVRHGHFGRAAESCTVTQPALSMQIRELERELGTDLLERRPGEIALTEAGIEIAERAEKILNDVHDLIDLARHRGRLLTGLLRLGIIPSLAPYVLPRVLPLLQSKYPDLRLEVRETQTKLLVEELAQGELDVIMVALPLENHEFETMRLFEDPFLLAVSVADALRAPQRVSANDVDRQRLILLEEGHCLREQALAFCSMAKSGAPTALGATSLATVMQMVANGYGITLVPKIATDTEARDDRVKLFRFRDPEPARTVGLAWRPTSPRKKDFAALGKIVMATFAAGRSGRRRRKKPA